MLYSRYCDASHAICPNTGRGRIGCVFLSAGAAVAWGSNRVGNASLSFCETGCMGLTMVAQEASFMIRLKVEKDKKTVVVLTESHSAKSPAENTVYHC